MLKDTNQIEDRFDLQMKNKSRKKYWTHWELNPTPPANDDRCIITMLSGRDKPTTPCALKKAVTDILVM